jgi:mRNA deadenylase 3'-5' endonuclease subunit Ccr4
VRRLFAHTRRLDSAWLIDLSFDTNKMDRKWIGPTASFRAMSYNVLADGGAKFDYGFVDKSDESLAWTHRGALLLDQIATIDADLVALLECTHFSDTFQPAFKKRGFECNFVLKDAVPDEKGWNDGAAIAWRTSVFALVASLGRSKDTKHGAPVISIVALLHLPSKRIVRVAATHLKAKRGQEKVRTHQCQQLARLLDEFDKTAKDANGQPVKCDATLLMGDFNAEEVEPCFSVLREASLNMLSGPSYTTMKQRRWSERDAGGVAARRIDYMFATNRLIQTAFLDAPDRAAVIATNYLPNEANASDHLPIVSTLMFL